MTSPRPRAMRILGIVLIAFAVLIGLYAAAAYIGLQSGRTLREERLQQERETELASQVTHAREDITAGQFSLAARRLRWVLEIDPDYPEARALLQEAEEAIGGTPQSAPTTPAIEEATATPALDGESDPGDGEENAEAAAELRRVEQLVEADDWEAAITALITLQHDYPNYERRDTDELLYEAYIAQGVELLYGDQIELGLYYLEQAERLGDLPQDVRDQQEWAELYLAGIGYFGVNWEVSLFYFRDLCLAAPFFHDACAKLGEALVAYGDQYAFQQEWCPAESIYQEATRQDDSDSLQQKLRQARQGCASATPTPAAPISGTVPVTGTMSITNTAPLPPGNNLQLP